MKFSPLPQDKIDGIHFVPQAIVNEAPDFFAAKGVQFHDEHDDLDAFVVSEMLLDGTLPFALIRYRGEPAGQTTISLPTERSLGHVQEVILSILQEFGLGQSSLAWMRRGTDTPY